MSVTPLPAALEFYELKKHIRSYILFCTTTGKASGNAPMEGEGQRWLDAINAIDLKYPIKGGVIVKEQGND